MKKFFSLLATLLVLALALWIGRTLWVHYMNTPWTRDGRVRADIINVAADVSGEVVEVPVRIHLDEVPDGVLLAAGMTCTVVVEPQG